MGGHSTRFPTLHHSQRGADLELAVPSGEGIHLHPGPDCASLTAHLVMFSKERSCPLEPGLQFLGLFHLKVTKESIL